MASFISVEYQGETHYINLDSIARVSLKPRRKGPPARKASATIHLAEGEPLVLYDAAADAFMERFHEHHKLG